MAFDVIITDNGEDIKKLTWIKTGFIEEDLE